MSIDEAGESIDYQPPEISPLTADARAAVHKLFDLPGDFVQSPSEAKSFMRLDKFWSETVSGELHIPKDKELFLGFDYDSGSQKVVLAEQQVGETDYHVPKRNHLIMLHTEPARDKKEMSVNIGPVSIFKPSDAVVFADNLPEAYPGDMRSLLKDPSIYAEIVIRLGLDNDPAATLIALRTNQSHDVYNKLVSHTLRGHLVLDEKNPVSQSLSYDKVVTEGGFAIYRGFTSIPPNHDDIFRLRKFD